MGGGREEKVGWGIKLRLEGWWLVCWFDSCVRGIYLSGQSPELSVRPISSSTLLSLDGRLS